MVQKMYNFRVTETIVPARYLNTPAAAAVLYSGIQKSDMYITTRISYLNDASRTLTERGYT